jgi:mannose-6-phosphate isomerase-like protein (cupin superfamily)
MINPPQPASAADAPSPTAQPTKQNTTIPIRRIVTIDDKNGLSTVQMDGPAPNVIGGLTELWTIGSGPADQHSTVDRGALSHSLNPPKHGTVFRYFQIPPESRLANLSGEEKRKIWADLFESMYAPDAQPDTRRDPGMHRTPTVDYIILLSGQITMVLDKQEVDMRPFDAVIQRGTNHAWVNKGTEDALLMAVLVDDNRE